MSNNGKWVYEECGAEIWHTSEGEFDTKEEAIKEGREYFKFMQQEYGDYEDVTQFSVGQIIHYHPTIEVYGLIEQVGEEAYEEVGEVAENYLTRVPHEEANLLSDKINEVFSQWMKETNNLPNFWMIRNTEDVSIEEGE
jgi:hypothetical protein